MKITLTDDEYNQQKDYINSLDLIKWEHDLVNKIYIFWININNETDTSKISQKQAGKIAKDETRQKETID